MEKIFVSRRGDKAPLLIEEISYDLGKTWTPTGKTKYDEENIEYDSCECSEEYRWTETREEVLADGKYYKKIILEVKYGCGNWERYLTENGYELVRLGEYLRDGGDSFYEDEVFHKEEEGDIFKDENGDCYITYDEYIWYDNKWIKINCEPIIGEKVDCE